MLVTSAYRWALSLLAIWLVGTVLAFWWFQGRLIEPFANSADELARYAQLHSSSDMRPASLSVSDAPNTPVPNTPVPNTPVLVLQLVDPACFCSRVNRVHREQLRQRYADSAVRFLEIQPDQTWPSEIWPKLAVARAPAALVLNHQGQLEYFGPFSTGAGCFTGEGTFVERAIDRALQQRSNPQINVLSTGCFCDWQMTV